MSAFGSATDTGGERDYPRSAHIESWLHSWVHGGSLAGASALLYQGDTEVCYYGTGMADAEQKLPIERDTIFRIYSMTKPITVLSALILIDRGLLSLNDPIEKWIPEFRTGMSVYQSGDEKNMVTTPLTESITVKQLMTHTSGMTYGFLGAHPCDKILCGHLAGDMAAWFRNTSLSELCAAIAKTPLCFEPGTKWHYGFSTDVLGHLVEKVADTTLPEFFQNEIFGPLNMQDTAFFVPPEKLHRLAKCYDLKGPNSGYALSTSIERDRSTLPKFYSGGGGLVSTIDDYMKFAQCVLHQGTVNGVRIISAETMRLMSLNHLPDGKEIDDMSFTAGFSETVGQGTGFGLGVSVCVNPETAKGSSLSGVGEFGWGGLASTWFTIDPVKNIVVVFMTQAVPSSLLPVRSHLKWLSHWVVGEE
jgi:CubicO group peptidase (beta-lactamase class C family)